MGNDRRGESGPKEIAQAVAGILVLVVVVFVMGLWFAGNPGPSKNPKEKSRTTTTVTPPLPVSVPTTHRAEKLPTQSEKPQSGIPGNTSPSKVYAGPVQELTVATWNVRDCAIVDTKTGIRTSFHQEIARVVKNAGVDILVLQEVQAETRQGADVTSLGFSLAKAGWTMPYTAILDTGTEDDMAIFSRFRITSQEPVASPGKDRGWPRPGLLVRIDLGGRELMVIDLHLKAMSDSGSLGQRRAQARALADYLRTRVDEDSLVVVAGDMNTTSVGDRLPAGGSPGSAVGTELGKPGMNAGTELVKNLGSTTLGLLQVRDDEEGDNDLFAVNEYLLPGKVTYDAGSYRNILDHILLSSAAKSNYMEGSVAVRDSDPDVDMRVVSDHFPVLLRLKIPLSDQ